MSSLHYGAISFFRCKTCHSPHCPGCAEPQSPYAMNKEQRERQQLAYRLTRVYDLLEEIGFACDSWIDNRAHTYDALRGVHLTTLGTFHALLDLGESYEDMLFDLLAFPEHVMNHI